MPPPRPIHWSAFTAEILRLYRPPMRRHATRSKTHQVLREFGRYCTLASDLDVQAIADWIHGHPHRRPATVDGLLRHLSAICTYGAFRGYMADPFDFRPVSEWLPADELDDVEAFGRNRSADEIRRVLARASEEALGGPWRSRRLAACVFAWAFTGAGKNEILGLRTGDLDLARGLLHIRSHPGRRLKTRARAAVLPIAPPLAAALADWIPQLDGCEWLFPHSYRTGPWMSGRPGHRPLDEVRALGERVGVRGLTILAFRHSLATLSESWGIGELMLQRLLRHARRRTQDAYRHPDLVAMREAAALIRF